MDEVNDGNKIVGVVFIALAVAAATAVALKIKTKIQQRNETK